MCSRLVFNSGSTSFKPVNNVLFLKTLKTPPILSFRFLSIGFPRLTEESKKPEITLAGQLMREKMEREKKEDKKENSEENSGVKSKPMGKWEKIGYSVFGISFVSLLISNAVIFSLPSKDENNQDIEDEFSTLPFPTQYYRRLKNKIFTTKKTYEEPFSEKVLPDPLKEPYYQPKYTVFLELTGLLVHANWTHKHGWRFQKRPGVDMLISQIGYPHFELVLYTTENVGTFFPIVDGLDPDQMYIMHRLFRDATRYINGHPTKDVTACNRDPKKVIFVDWNKDSVQLQPENALILEKWEGDNTDRTLIGLAQLLQAIKQSDVDDVREVLQHYRQFKDPIEAFRENQRKLQSEMIASEEKKEKEKKTSLVSGISSSFLRR